MRCQCKLGPCPHHAGRCRRKATTVAFTSPEQFLCRWCLDAWRQQRGMVEAAHLRDWLTWRRK